MQTILEKACQTVLAGENMGGGGGYNKLAAAAEMKDTINFPSLQDLNIYGSSEHLDLHHHHSNSMEQRTSMDSFTDNFTLAKKRYNNNSGKSPLIWADDLRLQELGTTTAAATASCLDDQNIHIDRASDDIDSVSDLYETKPMLDGDKKLDRPSPRRTSAISAGGMQQGRTSPFG